MARSARAVLLAGGPAALWLGALPTAIRQTLANAVRFFVYDRARRHVPDGVPAPAAVAGACTGCVSVLLTNPVDVVKTRVQAAPLQSGGAASSVEVVRNLLRDEGLQALGKGLGARLLKIGRRSSSEPTMRCESACRATGESESSNGSNGRSISLCVCAARALRPGRSCSSRAAGLARLPAQILRVAASNGQGQSHAYVRA